MLSELEEGRAVGVDAPDPKDHDWFYVEAPTGAAALDLETDLGHGETEVLGLVLERDDAVAVLDDRLARRVARTLDVPLTGTLGILPDAKKAGMVESVTPLIDHLQKLGFRLAAHTRQAVTKLAGESS